MALSKEQLKKYERDGYVIVDFGFSQEMIDDIVAGMVKHSAFDCMRDEQGQYKFGARVQDAWRTHESVRQLATHPTVLETLHTLYARKPQPFQTLNFPIGTQQPTHSDTIHFNSMPSGYMCGIWVALEDIDENNGPLKYFPGSHKLPEVTMEDVEAGAVVGGVSRSFKQKFFDSLRQILTSRKEGINMSGMTMDAMTGGKNYQDYEAFIADMVAKAQMRSEFGLLKKGQALIWAANLLHGGSPHHDRSRTRFSQVTHYYFEGCKYYTPLFSRGTNMCWRNPEWIPGTPLAAKAA